MFLSPLLCVCVYMQRHMYVFYIHILNVVQNDGILALSINRNWTNSNFNRKPKICPLNMSTGKHPDFLSCVDRTQQSLQNRPEVVLTEGSHTSLLFSESQTSSPNMERSQEHWTNDKEQVSGCRPSVNGVQGTPSAAHSWYPPSAALAPSLGRLGPLLAGSKWDQLCQELSNEVPVWGQQGLQTPKAQGQGLP